MHILDALKKNKCENKSLLLTCFIEVEKEIKFFEKDLCKIASKSNSRQDKIRQDFIDLSSRNLPWHGEYVNTCKHNNDIHKYTHTDTHTHAQTPTHMFVHQNNTHT